MQSALTLCESLESCPREQVVEQLKLVTSMVPSGMLAIDSDGRILLANAELEGISKR